MEKIRLSLEDRSYDIMIAHGLLAESGAIIRRLNIGRDAVVISNKILLTLYRSTLEKSFRRSGFTVRFEAVPDSEKAKSLKILSDTVTRISSYDKNRSVFLVAFGGGVIGDLTGFIAAIYKRGVPYIQIPTTLLAQVDSAIGGKVAVDLPVAKNLLGAFYQPKAVLSDISLISSLSVRQIKNGLAEIIKYGAIKDKELFEYLERYHKRILSLDRNSVEFIVARASSIKARVVEQDEYDNKGERIILNFGHTIGHAIETASGYSQRYNHGEAIAIGMAIAGGISLKLGLARAPDIERLEALIKNCGLPVSVKGLDLSKIFDAHLHDKKFIDGANRFILPIRIGSVKTVKNVPNSVIRGAIKDSLCR